MKIVIMLLAFSMLPLQAFAFDKINCESQLFDWSVWNGFGNKNKVLYALQPAISLSEKESRVLIVKSQNGKSIIEIYPWDGIDLITKDKSHKYTIQTDKLSWFEIQFSGTHEKKLLCYLSF
jgi:hypothetical protein